MQVRVILYSVWVSFTEYWLIQCPGKGRVLDLGLLAPLRKKGSVEKSQGKPRTRAGKGRRIIQHKTNGKFRGERPVGRPRLRWGDYRG